MQRQRLTAMLVLVALGTDLASLTHVDAANPFKRGPRRKTSVDAVGKRVAKLENALEYTGSIAAKSPDVWGQARLTQHREEFEKQMHEQLNAFTVNFNAEVARSDQAYLAEAISLAATVNLSNGAGGNIDPPKVDVTTLNSMVSPITGRIPTAVPADKLTPEQLKELQAEAQTQGSFTVIRNDPFSRTNMPFAGNQTIALEPEIILDQRKRFLNHLHEIRRINEGDDNTDAPGYSLNLVRIPVSILPGVHTREGYGAEITVTATPHITDELLPQTFRALVINDLVDQLSFPIVKYLDSVWPLLRDLEKLEGKLRQQRADQAGVQTALLAIDQIERNNQPAIQVLTEIEKSNSGSVSVKSAVRSARTRLVESQQKEGTALNGQNSSDQPNFAAIKENLKVELDGRANSLPLEVKQTNNSITDMNLRFAAFQDNIQSIQLGAGQRSRRSRFAVPPSLLLAIYGADELKDLAMQVFRLRDRKRCNFAALLPEVQGFLREELDSAYELLTHKQIRYCAQDGSLASSNLWGWVTPELGQSIRGQNDFAEAMSPRVVDRIRKYRQSFYSTMHAANSESMVTRTGGKGGPSRRVQLASMQSSENDSLFLPPSPGDTPEAESYSANPQTEKGIADFRSPEEHGNITEALSWAVLVESVLLNDRLNEDLIHVAQDPKCSCQPGGSYVFYGPNPAPEARLAFMDYVRCRWPIHVFALDPEVQQQNIADSFSMRREAQLAIALAFTRQFVNSQSLTRYMRRIEVDMKTIALNNTVVGFGHGDNVFGWRFTPRIQTPPFESNLTVVMRDLIVGGPNADALLRRQRLEPGARECVAMVVMPSFIRHVKFETHCNWFKLSNSCMQKITAKGPTMDYILNWSRDIREMQDAAECCFAEQHLYRDGEVERLMNRVEQLSQKLPMQTLYSHVPYENTLGGFEMFSSGVTDLAPEVIGFYGVPGIDPNRKTELFLVGNHFSVHDTRVMAGNKMCEVNMLSRNVMQITVPSGVQIHKRRQSDPTVNYANADRENGETVPDSPLRPIPQNDSRVPCSDVDPNLCPRLCDPCCNSEYVEIRMATPYGVAGAIDVPVVARAENQPQLAWGTDEVAVTYYYKKAATVAIETADIRISGDREIVISAINGMLLPNNAPFRLDLALFGIVTGIDPVSGVGITLDSRAQRYVIRSESFSNFHKNLKETVVAQLNGLGDEPIPSNLVLNLSASVWIDSNTQVPVTGELPIRIRLVKKGP